MESHPAPGRHIAFALTIGALAASSPAQHVIREHAFAGFAQVVVAGLRDVDGDNVAAA